MRNISDKSCMENQNTYFKFNIFFRKSCLLWDNVEIYCRLWQVTYENVAHAIACRISKATNTLSEYVIYIVFPLQHCLHERVSISRLSTLPVFFLLFIIPSWSPTGQTQPEWSVYRPCVIYESGNWINGCDKRGKVAWMLDGPCKLRSWIHN